MKSSWKRGIQAAGAVASTGVWLYRENRAVDVEAIPVPLPGLPAAFHGMRIAILSDIHLPGGLSIDKLVRITAMQRPDAIFLPGDITNSYAAFDADGLRALARALSAVAPCYAAPGNHEWRLGRLEETARILRAAGVRFLCDRWTLLKHDGAAVTLLGMGCKRPRPLAPECPRPVIALAHHPERLEEYAQAGWDLVIAGHAHGGQFRLGTQGFYSPGEGMLPRYTSGLYRQGETAMVVSRGLGNSTFPLRLGNRLHLPVLVLAEREAPAPRLQSRAE